MQSSLSAEYDEQWQEIRSVQKRHRFFYQFSGGIVLVLIGAWIGSKLFSGDTGYLINLYTEGISIAITVFVLNALARRRENDRERARLIRQMRSSDNGLALLALDELRTIGAITDGSLEKKNFYRADLTDAHIENARLQGASFSEATLRCVRGQHADFTEAWLTYCDAQNADFADATFVGARLNFSNFLDAVLANTDARGAHMARAYFMDVNFERANLRGSAFHHTNLQGSKFIYANLQGTSLTEADLTGAVFYEQVPKGLSWTQGGEEVELVTIHAFLDESTWLPDGTPYKPELGIEQLSRFTDPNHPDYWYSADPTSPAHPNQRKRYSAFREAANQ